MKIEIKQEVEIDVVNELLKNPDGCKELIDDIGVLLDGPGQIYMLLDAGIPNQTITKTISLDSLVDNFIESYFMNEGDYPEGVTHGTNIIECFERNTVKLRAGIEKAKSK